MPQTLSTYKGDRDRARFTYKEHARLCSANCNNVKIPVE